MDNRSRIYCGKKTWLEGPAIEQFNRVMDLPGILRGAAFPDLHPGRGVPVGAAFLSQDLIYPVLIGNDIGCGMTLFATGISLHKFKKNKLLRRLGSDPEKKSSECRAEYSRRNRKVRCRPRFHAGDARTRQSFCGIPVS